jgi:hypothetical protein
MKLSKALSAENVEGAENQDNILILFLTRRTYFFVHISTFSALSALIFENVRQLFGNGVDSVPILCGNNVQPLWG